MHLYFVNRLHIDLQSKQLFFTGIMEYFGVTKCGFPMV